MSSVFFRGCCRINCSSRQRSFSSMFQKCHFWDWWSPSACPPYFIPSLMGKQSVKNRRWRLPCTTSPLVIPHPGLSNSSGWNMHTTPSPVLPLVSCLFSVPDDTSQHSLQSKNDRPTIHQSRSALLSTHLEAGLTLTPLPSRC